MAVNAAHLTRTNGERPSIFEVIAQESLQATLRPALNKLAQFLCFLDPKKYGWILKRFDECYLLLNTLLQSSYLKYTAASFSENFYGLHRLSLKKQTFHDGIHLSYADEKLSLFFLALFPYLRTKLDRFAERYAFEQHPEFKSQDWRQKMKHLLFNFHSVFHFFYEFARLAQFLLYISGKSNSHSPPLRMLSLSLAYSSEPTAENRPTWSGFWNATTEGKPGSAKITFEMIGTALLRCMEMGAFFVQFVKWWDDKGPRVGVDSMPVPQFPEGDTRAATYTNRCPLCLQNWKIPTAVAVSGYIFCYKCITRHLKDEPRCPVTRYYVHEDDVIRLYI